MQYLEELRSRLHQGTFQPCTIHLADGRALPLPHPDFIAITCHVIVVVDELGMRHLFEPSDIAEISDGCTQARPA